MKNLGSYFQIMSLALFATSISQACPKDSNRLCKGDYVLNTKDDSVAVIHQVFNNGQVELFSSGLNYYWVSAARNLSPSVRQFTRFKVGDELVDDEFQHSTIERIFKTGKAQVILHMGYPGKATTVISLKDKHIGRRIRKVGSFTEGARAIDNERNIGKILRLYDNGKAVLAFDKHQVGPGTVGSLVKLSNLSLTTSPCVNLSK